MEKEEEEQEGKEEQEEQGCSLQGLSGFGV